MKKPKERRERSYSNSRLQPKQLTAKREQELRTYPYHNGGGINYRAPFGRKDKLWSETQRDELLQHIDWLQQELTNPKSAVGQLFTAAWGMSVEQQAGPEGWSMAKRWAFDNLAKALEPFRTEYGDELDYSKICPAPTATPNIQEGKRHE